MLMLTWNEDTDMIPLQNQPSPAESERHSGLLGLFPRESSTLVAVQEMHAKCFVERGHHVVEVDISASGMGLAKMKVPTATFELFDSETRLPSPDEPFDICFCTEVIDAIRRNSTQYDGNR
jgi:hypothetical protein